jgi:flagellar basal-body rod modification protein FlgD
MPAPIGNASNTTIDIAGIKAKGKSTLDMATFLKLLTVQLQSQDPLNPISDSQFAAQLAEMGTVQGMDNLQRAGQIQMAASLLGKSVTAANPNITSTDSNPIIAGKVVGMTNDSGTINLTVLSQDGHVSSISANSIRTVTN